MANQTLDYGHPYFLFTRSDTEAVDPSWVSSFVSQIVTRQYFSVALLTALVYHAFITMDKEVKYFWCHPCNPTSLVYFANRYIGILGAISTIASRTSVWTRELCNLTTIVLIHYILQVRVMALYHQNRRLSIILKLLLAMDAAIGLGLVIYPTLFEDIKALHLPLDIDVCVTGKEIPRSLEIISWVVPIVYGTILLCLALLKAAEYWRISAGFKGFHLVRVLIEDQALYYGFVIICCVLQILELSTNFLPIVTTFLNAAGSPTLLSIIGGHLLISMKEAGERGANKGTSLRLSDMSDIVIAEDSPTGLPRDEGLLLA